MGRVSGASESSDLALQLSCVESGDTGRLSGAVDICNGGLLQLVDFDEVAAQTPAQKRCELSVWHGGKAAGKKIPRFVPGLRSVGELNRFEEAGRIIWEGGHWPATCAVRSFSEGF